MGSLRSRFLMFAALARRPVRRAGVLPGRTHQRRRARHHRRRGSRESTVTITNQATGATQTVTSGTDGSYSVTVPPGVYSVSVSLRGFGRQTRRDVEVGAAAPRRTSRSSRGPRKRSPSPPCCASRRLADVPFSVAAPTEDELRQRGVDNIEGVAANVAGFTVQNLGPGQSQVAMRGVSVGTDRARPAGRQGAGGRLPRRLHHLPLPVHPGPRPVRRRARRGAARAAGHPLRRRLALRHRALHQQPARARREEVLRRARRQRGRRRQPGRQRQARLQRARGRQGRRAGGRLLQPYPRLHGRGAARPQRERGRQRRQPHRRAGGDQVRAQRSASPSPRGSSTSRWRWTAGTASTPSTSSPIPTPRRGRR